MWNFCGRIGIVLLSLWTCGAAWADSTSEVLAARIANLQNFAVECVVDDFYSPPPAALEVDPKKPAELRGVVRRGKYTRKVSIAFFKGNMSVSSVKEPEMIAHDVSLGLARPIFKDVYSFTEGRVEHLTWVVGKPAPLGVIVDSERIPYEWTVDLALGLRLLGGERFLSAEDVRRGRVTSEGGDFVTVSLSDSVGDMHVWTLDKRRGYAISKYVVEHDHAISEVIECSEFENHESLWLPTRILRGNYTGSRLTTTVRSIKYVLNDANNGAEKLRMQWPGGARVFDTRSKMSIDVGATTRPLSDADIFSEVKKQEAMKEQLLRETQERINRVSGSTVPASRPSAGTGR